MKGSDVVGPTTIADTETQLGGADLVLPSWARSILAIRPTVTNATPTNDEPLVHKIKFESEDFSIQPYEVLCAPTGPNIGANSGVQAPESPWYPMNCPVNGGDRLQVFGNEISALTADAFMSCQIILSDKKAGSQYHAKVGTWTDSGAVGIYTPETAYTLTGGHTLEELYGIAMPVPAAELEGMTGYFEFRSNDYEDPTPLKLPTNPISPNIGTGGAATPGVARAKVELGILSPCKITGSLTLADVPTTGKFVTGVLFR